MILNRDDMQTCIDEVNEDGAIEPHWDYSGRGMFNVECFGIVGDYRTLALFLLRVVPEVAASGIATTDTWLNMRADSMARQMIFYWPDVTVEE